MLNFESVYRDHYVNLCATLRKMGFVQNCEDIAQETFLRVQSRLTEYDANRASVFTWIVSIARRVGLMDNRAQNRRIQNEIAFGENVPDSVEIDMDRVNAIRAKLSPARTAVMDAIFDGGSREDICNRLGISDRMYRQHISDITAIARDFPHTR